MKFFKYLFFLILLVFVVGSLYIATVSLPSEKSITFETQVNPKLFKNKIQDLSTYTNWFSFPGKTTSDMRLSNAEEFANTTLSWQNEKFESINFQNKELIQDSIVQQLTLKTWLSSSEIDISWKSESSSNNSKLVVHLKFDPSFWQKTEFVLKRKSHLDITEKAINESLKTLRQLILEEISVYDISSIGKVDSGGFYILHATSASRLNFESILKKSKPIFESVEDFMEEQQFDTYKGRLIVFENLFEGSNNLIFSSGIDTNERIAIPDNFEVLIKAIPRGTYFKTQLTGDYVNLKELLSVAEATIENRDLVINRRFKSYLEFEVDASETINPSKWVTNFYIPITDN